MKRLLTIGMVSLCCLASSASAFSSEGAASAANNLRDSYEQCAAASHHAMPGMQSCIDSEFTYQDARLNDVYRKLQSTLPVARKTNLRDEERVWLAEKNTACSSNTRTGEQAQRIEANTCSLNMTASRAKVLENLLSDSDNASDDKNASHTRRSAAATAATPAATAQDKGNKMDDLKAFATGGNKILDAQTGDLSGAGRNDALLVLDPPGNGNQKLGEGAPRNVLLLVRDAQGQLQQFAHNDRIVPCASCGGIAGDPFGYVRLEPGQFTIVNGGGGREHWADEFTFKYFPEHKDWLIAKVVRRVEDRETGEKKVIDLTGSDLGAVTFKEFDPSRLPEAELH
ncbi:lysozyme inhibitor LprI family protein [Dyella silvatica]|uniref:lysozyme inhibitor LprI family protein n=1 Tax=Dyella silvatica TaxID=2992128 RepID=UPI0022542E35|nr:lysozyme inhibitor LprI family protein [Dyella silvatica]